MSERRFPIMSQGPRNPRYETESPGFTVPWELVEPLRDVAEQVHGQSLERLAQRGGLSRYELGCLLVGISGVFGAPHPVLDGQHETMPVLSLLAQPTPDSPHDPHDKEARQ